MLLFTIVTLRPYSYKEIYSQFFILAFEDFYNESLNNVIEVQVDIENALARTRKFSFLKYSFVLNAATKVLKLFFESKVQMFEERKRTVYNLFFSGGGGDDHPFLNLQVNRNTLLLDALGNVSLFVCLSVCLFVCLLVCLSVCLSVCTFYLQFYFLD